MGTSIGYCRVSTTDQDLTAQEQAVTAEGVTKIFREYASGAKQDRPELAKMFEYAREGDTIVVSKLDRLARSTAHLLQIIEELKNRGIAFKALNVSGLDTSTATGELMVTMLGAVAQFERTMMKERQREGIALAKQRGVYRGRKPTAQAKADEVFKLLDQGMPKAQIAKKLGIGRSSLYRILEQREKI